MDKRHHLMTIISANAPELEALVVQSDSRKLTDDEREALRAVLSDRFCLLGVNADFEPNAFGMEIEDLIDYVGHL